MKTNQQPAERQNCQITPFTYEDRAVRTVLIDDEPWFVAKDICDVLDIKQPTRAVEDFPENETGVTTIHIRSENGVEQSREMLVINEPGLYRLIFQSRKPEAEKFKTWVFTEVLPCIRRTGAYVPKEFEGNAVVCEIYRLFSGCHDMTLHRINKVIYYFAMNPPLTNMDIAKLLGVSDSIVSLWRKRLTQEMAQNAVKLLGINACGMTEKQKALQVKGALNDR